MLTTNAKIEYRHLALYAAILIVLGLIWDGATRMARPYPKTEVHVFQVTTTNTYVLTNIHTKEIIYQQQATPQQPYWWTNKIYIDNNAK